MKVLFNFCCQPRPYADSVGKCLIQLDPDDDICKIISDYTKDRAIFEVDYSRPVRLTTYSYKGVTYDGDLVLFDTHQYYLD